ncbi:hypothetical protein CHS0354_041153 [Potamilus streckersoni]|uniref:Uncharacterized protein n=1 Tax=Potamilus streckersoni TaxID=2493646 RepID=A0AAE0SDK2_9BIVA|nr:hypothetical protein CHS0354_041153 [Potamilus streckersoni]
MQVSVYSGEIVKESRACLNTPNLIIVVVLSGVVTWTVGINLPQTHHNAKTSWKDPCKDRVHTTFSPFDIEENSNCAVADIIDKWIPELNTLFGEISQSLTNALNTFRSVHGSEPSHVKIEELEDPASNITFAKLINRKNNKETEKIIYRNYSSLTILAAYLNVVNSKERIDKNLSDAIKRIKGALCNMKMLAKSLALDSKNIIPKIWEFSHDFQTKSYTELMNFNETVLTQGQEIIANLSANFKANVKSSLSICKLKCQKKRKLVCEAKGQKKRKGNKNKPKMQPNNKKGKKKNRSS